MYGPGERRLPNSNKGRPRAGLYKRIIRKAICSRCILQGLRMRMFLFVHKIILKVLEMNSVFSVHVHFSLINS